MPPIAARINKQGGQIKHMPPEEQFDRLLRKLKNKIPSWVVWLTLDTDLQLKGWELEPAWGIESHRWRHAMDDLPGKSGIVHVFSYDDFDKHITMDTRSCKVLAEPYRFAQKQKAKSAAQQPLPDITNMLPPDYPDAWL